MALQSMTALASITLQEASASVTFSGIPQNYRDLVLVSAFTTTTSGVTFDIRLNADTSSTYSHVGMSASGTSGAISFAFTSTGKFEILGNTYGTSPVQSIFQLMDYSATDKHKTALARSSSADTTAMNRTTAYAMRYPSTSAITSLSCHSFFGSVSFAAGSTFNLYGRIA
jgi:hypothetical protein